MKKFLPFLALVFLVACNSKPTETETRTLQSSQAATQVVDTAGLAQFQQWKAQNELAAVNPTPAAPQPAAEPVKTITIIREVRVPQAQPVRKPVKHSTAPVPTAPVETPESHSTAGAIGNETSSSESAGTAEAPVAQPAETAQRKGWSKATKGAVIGGVGGAVIGAVINKNNRAAGAVIGGVLGAGVGYGIGKSKDNKVLQMH